MSEDSKVRLTNHAVIALVSIDAESLGAPSKDWPEDQKSVRCVIRSFDFCLSTSIIRALYTDPISVVLQAIVLSRNMS